MDFRIRQLQCFLTLAELLNYGKTARVLYMSQPTITFQIQSLEEAFGAKLFERDRKQVRLTAAGESMRTYAQTIMDTIGQAREHLKSLGAPRKLRITCGPSGMLDLLPAVLRTLARSHAGFEVEVADLTTEEQMEQMADRRIDVMIMMPALPIAGVHFVPLCTSPLRVLMSRRNPLASRGFLSVRELHGANVIASRPEDCRYQGPFLANLFSPYDVVPRLVHVPQSCSVQFAYVGADAGVMIAPYSAGFADLPDVVSIPFVEPLPEIELGYSVLADNKNEALPMFHQILLHCAAKLQGAPPAAKVTRSDRSRLIEFPHLRDAV
jgi:DNA-binding transcriptional LysR family regulator